MRFAELGLPSHVPGRCVKPQKENAMALRTEGNAPTRKVTAAAVAGAAASVVVYVLNVYVLPPDRPLTPEIAAALTTLVGFAACYLVPPDGRRTIDTSTK